MKELAIAIWLVILINGAFSFWQEHRASKATEALKLARKLKNSELAANALELLDRLPKWAEEPEFIYERSSTGVIYFTTESPDPRSQE